jgi:sugar lactone lactonase YvrE
VASIDSRCQKGFKMKFKLLVDADVTIAETPIWDKRIQKLYWTDSLKGEIHRYDPVTNKEEVW